MNAELRAIFEADQGDRQAAARGPAPGGQEPGRRRGRLDSNGESTQHGSALPAQARDTQEGTDGRSEVTWWTSAPNGGAAPGRARGAPRGSRDRGEPRLLAVSQPFPAHCELSGHGEHR